MQQPLFCANNYSVLVAVLISIIDLCKLQLYQGSSNRLRVQIIDFQHLPALLDLLVEKSV